MLFKDGYNQRVIEMPEIIGVGVIGCGNMGRKHSRLLSHMKAVHMRGFADTSLERAEQLCRELNGEYATHDVDKLLGDSSIDLVLICTHHDSHAPLCIQAAEAGKHIFVEKPLALTIEECLAIERAVASANVKLMVGFQARFSPFVHKLKEVIPKPLVTVGQLTDPRWHDTIWANDPRKGGGNVLSQGCHCFDLVYWFNECEPVTVYAEGGNFLHPALPITDSIVATLRFDSGAVASVIIGDFGHNPFTGKAFYELFDGAKTGTLYGYYADPALRFWGADIEEFTVEHLPENERDRDHSLGYVQMLQAMVAWVKDDEEPTAAAKVRDGTRATLLGLKAIEAAKNHTPQSVWE